MDALTQTQVRGALANNMMGAWPPADPTALLEANPLSSHGLTTPTPPAVYAQLIQDTTELSPEARRDLHATRRAHRHPHNPPPPRSNEAFREHNPRPEDPYTQEDLMMIRDKVRAFQAIAQGNPNGAALMLANFDRIRSERGMGLGVQWI